MPDTLRPSADGSKQTIGLAVAGNTAHGSVGVALNAAATVVFAADSERGLIVGQIVASYKGTTTPTGRLTLADSSGNLLDVDINNDQVLNLRLDPPILCGKNSNVTATLHAGGAAATGKLNLLVWKV